MSPKQDTKPGGPSVRERRHDDPKRGASSSSRATDQVRRGRPIEAATPRERSPKQENL